MEKTISKTKKLHLNTFPLNFQVLWQGKMWKMNNKIKIIICYLSCKLFKYHIAVIVVLFFFFFNYGKNKLNKKSTYEMQKCFKCADLPLKCHNMVVIICF